MEEEKNKKLVILFIAVANLIVCVVGYVLVWKISPQIAIGIFLIVGSYQASDTIRGMK